MDSGSAVFHFQFSILSKLAADRRQQKQQPSSDSQPASLYAAPVPSRLPHAVHCHLAGSGPSLTSKAGLTRTLSREQRWIGIDSDDFYPRAVELKTAEDAGDGTNEDDEELRPGPEWETEEDGGEPTDVQRAAEPSRGRARRAGRGRQLCVGERELLQQYRWQTAVCVMKRAVVSSLQPQQPEHEEEAAELETALRGGREWLRHLQRGGRWRRRQQTAEDASGEGAYGAEAASKLQEKDWDWLVSRFERSRDGHGPRSDTVSPAAAGGRRPEESKEQLTQQPATSTDSRDNDPFCPPSQRFSPHCFPSCPFLLSPLASSSAPPAVLSCLHSLSHCDPQFAMSGLDNLWICKPGGLSRGRGIAVLRSLSALQQHCKAAASAIAGRQLGSFICQRYIERPLLLAGHKFDLRLWAVVRTSADLPSAASSSPSSSACPPSALRRSVYAYDDLYCRLASVSYSAHSLSPFVHLTNQSVQVSHPDFASTFSSGNQLSLLQLSAAVAREHPLLPPLPSLLPAMHRIVLSTVQAAEQSSLSAPSLSYDDGRERYALLGFDFMLDEQGGVWLLECNSSPTLCGIAVPGLVDRMLDELMQLLCGGMEQRVRGAAGGGRRPYETRQAVGGWQLLDCCELVHRSGIELSVRGHAIRKAADRAWEANRRSAGSPR